MDDFVTRVFLDEIKQQCEFAFMALSDMDSALKIYDNNRFWYSLHSFLTTSGNISKILWPVEKKYNIRGVKLRQLLNITQNSSLQQRNLRNHFEHFDERLETWANFSVNKIIIDKNICSGPVSQNISSFSSESYLRNFDTTNFEVTFTNETYKMSPLVEEIKSIYSRLKQIENQQSGHHSA